MRSVFGDVVRGSYFLVIRLDDKKSIKTKGKQFILDKGFYVYVGSAMNSLEKRVERHFKKSKKLHWHIDFLLKNAELLRAYLIPSEMRLEETLSMEVSKYGRSIDNFGSSDVSTPSNLYQFDTEPDEILIRILKMKGLKWKMIKSPDEIKKWREINEHKDW